MSKNLIEETRGLWHNISTSKKKLQKIPHIDIKDHKHNNCNFASKLCFGIRWYAVL